MDVSVVVPLLNEAESLPELISWIDKVLSQNKYTYEVIMIDDGSTDNSWNVINELKEKYHCLKGIKFRRNFGKSAALHTGFQHARGNVVITMDADLQDSPEEIPEFVNMIRNGGYDLVSGWKKKRFDPVFAKNLPSKFFNWTARRMSGIKLHDFNCGLKAYRNRVVKGIEIYGEMHRYIPVLAKWAGFKKIGEKIVRHQERKYGTTKFGVGRFMKGPLDLLSIMFISKYGKRPMHLFGTLGTLTFVFGLAMAAIVGSKKIIAIKHHVLAPLVTSSPYFYIALTCMVIGSLLFLTGFLGELISRSSSERNNYHIEEEL
ncbi:Dodecaprenyl-phosphate galacturonate synthase [subsurface metagenome]